MFINNITDIAINLYTGDKNDRGYDFSMLNSINTCPFYGIIRHIHNKVFNNSNRDMALECGDLCHKCFAAYRALSIYYSGIKEEKTTKTAIGRKYLFNLIKNLVNNELDDDVVNQVLDDLFTEAETKVTPVAKYTVFSNWIIDNSGYYDEPDDKKRTIANIKESLLSYLSNFLSIIEDEPVWIEDENNVDSKIGIELPFDLTISISFDANGEEHTQDIHFIGKIDGVHVKDGKIILHENKTASRLDDSWSEQWYKSHQITGYCLAVSYLVNKSCFDARVLGMQIPITKYTGNAFRTERVDRELHYFSDWARWVLTNHEIIENYKNNPEKAPMNTHACCKYYKACSFMPLCVQNEEERLRIMNEEMIDKPWSPLDE